MTLGKGSNGSLATLNLLTNLQIFNVGRLQPELAGGELPGESPERDFWRRFQSDLAGREFPCESPDLDVWETVQPELAGRELPEESPEVLTFRNAKLNVRS